MSVVPIGTIDTGKFARDLRRHIINADDKSVRIVSFADSLQRKDFTLPSNCAGFGRVHHFRKSVAPDWPENPLPIDPAAKYLGMGNVGTLRAQVFQNAGCSWRCWYCFVDDNLLAATPKGSTFVSAEELLDLYEREAQAPALIDLSGGQPDLVPEWVLWVSDELKKRNLMKSVYLWSDDNLSNDYLWRYLNGGEIRRIASLTNYSKVGCFKGFDEYSFSFNTRAESGLFATQFAIAHRLIHSGISLYGYVTLTTDRSEGIRDKVRCFVDRLQELVHPNFPLRTVPLRIFPFSPTRARAGLAFDSALQIQAEVVAAWLEELNSRFSLQDRQKPIYSHSLAY